MDGNGDFQLISYVKVLNHPIDSQSLISMDGHQVPGTLCLKIQDPQKKSLQNAPYFSVSKGGDLR